MVGLFQADLPSSGRVLFADGSILSRWIILSTPGCHTACSCWSSVCSDYHRFVRSGLASARDQVAPSSQKQWAPANLAGYQDTLQKGSVEALEKGKELVDRRKEYTLPDLIDLAQQLNPATRAAWQNAKQALALVGVSKSAYYPFLSLAAAAGYTRFFVPFPKLEVNQALLRRSWLLAGPCKRR